VRRNVLGIQVREGLTVDEQAVASEHDGGLDSISLADRANEVANCGHRRSWGIRRRGEARRGRK